MQFSSAPIREKQKKKMEKGQKGWQHQALGNGQAAGNLKALKNRI